MVSFMVKPRCQDGKKIMRAFLALYRAKNRAFRSKSSSAPCGASCGLSAAIPCAPRADSGQNRNNLPVSGKKIKEGVYL
jgi:hypothetical protein